MNIGQSEFEVRLLHPDEYGHWDEMVRALPTATIFSESRWLTAVAEIMVCEVKIVAVFHGDHLVGGVPIRISRRFGMPVADGIPLTPTNSCIVVPTSTTCLSKMNSRLLAITEAMASFLQTHYAYVILTHDPALIDIRSFNWLDWRSQVLYTYHIEMAKADLANLSSTVRKNIRHAEKAGVTSEVSRDFRQAHEPLVSTFARQGAQLPLTAEQLVAFGERLGDDLVLLLARSHDGRIIATEIILLDRPHKIAYRFLAGFDATNGIRGVAAFLQWQGLIYCRDIGLEILDQVGADIKEVAAFKAELGGRLVPYYQISKAGLGYKLLNRAMLLGKRVTDLGRCRRRTID
ncbi:MAG TPA: hypothetical protein DEQ20_04810 [Desulfobulbaceae bacterium]|nr:MAG: hypothetical protein A2520_03075 [Deltaproteobacteria bacterium RIFOXYD12_FULL_53_23]HCC54232.1 hypothetical protein [Desulfobulbaceae bacterium]